MENVEVKEFRYVDIIFKLFIGVFIVLDLMFLVQKSIVLSDGSFFLGFEEILIKNKSIIIEIVLLLVFLIIALICFVKYIRRKNIFVNLNIKSKIKFIVLLIVFIVGMGCYTSLAINDYNQQKINEANEAKEKAICDSRAELLIKTNEVKSKIDDFSFLELNISGLNSIDNNIGYISDYIDVLNNYVTLIKSKKDVIKDSEIDKYNKLIKANSNLTDKFMEILNFYSNDYESIDMYNKFGSYIGVKDATDSLKKYADIIKDVLDINAAFINSCIDFATEIKENN